VTAPGVFPWWSVWGRNWYYLCGTVEKVAAGETVEIVSIHALFMDVAEKMVE
jgi:hypothetical protein